MNTYFVFVKIKIYPWDDWFYTGFYYEHYPDKELYHDMLVEADKMYNMCHLHEVYGYAQDKKIVD